MLVGILALFLLAWAYDALEEAEDRREAAREFAGNAARGTGGFLNVVLVGIVSAVGGAAAAGMTVADTIGFLSGFVPEVPILAASLFTISLGAVGLSGLLVIKWWHFALLGLAAVSLAAAWRSDRI
ncbi:MAG: hypothetical protein ABEJ00_03325 [Gemmatimonadota bacterium]